MAGDRQTVSLAVFIPRRFLRVQSLRVGVCLSDSRTRRPARAHIAGFCATNVQTATGPADMEEEVES